MRALALEGRRVELREVPDPEAGPEEAVVRVHLAGVCNTDLELARGYMGFDGILGHEFVGDVVNRSAPPKGVKIRYATQTGSAPPRFTLFANRPKDLPESYIRYIENSLRERYGLWGVSVRIRAKSSR